MYVCIHLYNVYSPASIGSIVCPIFRSVFFSFSLFLLFLSFQPPEIYKGGMQGWTHEKGLEKSIEKKLLCSSLYGCYEMQQTVLAKRRAGTVEDGRTE